MHVQFAGPGAPCVAPCVVRQPLVGVAQQLSMVVLFRFVVAGILVVHQSGLVVFPVQAPVVDRPVGFPIQAPAAEPVVFPIQAPIVEVRSPVIQEPVVFSIQAPLVKERVTFPIQDPAVNEPVVFPIQAPTAEEPAVFPIQAPSVEGAIQTVAKEMSFVKLFAIKPAMGQADNEAPASQANARASGMSREKEMSANRGYLSEGGQKRRNVYRLLCLYSHLLCQRRDTRALDVRLR